MTTKMIGVKEFRQNMAKISEEVSKKNQRLIIMRKNKPIFELRPLSDKEVTLESLVMDINDSLDDMKNNRVYSHEEMKDFFGLV